MPMNIETIWNEFKNDIMYKNRHFANDSIMKILDRFKKFHKIKMLPDDTKMDFYRARIGDYVHSKDEDILPPPKEIANSGRCNPEGIPYLYLASNEETAISEIRPEKGHYVTVAKLHIDVSNIFSFCVYDTKMKWHIKIDDDEVKSLIELINNDFSCTITPDDKFGYIPLQYISEYVKHLGYHGFVFRSSLGPGMNLVMFNWAGKIVFQDKKLFKVTDVGYKSQVIKK